MEPKKYTVDRIVDGHVVLLEYNDESNQVIVPLDQFAPVSEGDLVLVTWSLEKASNVVVLKRETDERFALIQDKLNKLKNKGR